MLREISVDPIVLFAHFVNGSSHALNSRVGIEGRDIV